MGNAHDITLAYAIIIIVVVSSAANAATVVCGDGLQSNETKVVMNKERRRRRRRHQGMGGFRIRLHWQKDIIGKIHLLKNIGVWNVVVEVEVMILPTTTLLAVYQVRLYKLINVLVHPYIKNLLPLV
jgi:hypothetical protein